MHKFAGAGLIILGLILMFCFAANGMLAGNEEMKSGKAGIMLPFKTIGRDYPKDVLLLLFGIASTVIGLVIMFRRMGVRQTDTPRVARALLLNAILMAIFILTAYIGAKIPNPEKNASAIGVFTLIVFLQIAIGAVFLIGAMLSRKRFNPSTIAGSTIYVLGTLLTVLSMLFGGTGK